MEQWRLLQCNLLIVVVAPFSLTLIWCSRVSIPTSSTAGWKGPARQLLSFRSTFTIQLSLSLPVASRTTGTLEIECSLWYMASLLALGTTTLSTISLVGLR